MAMRLGKARASCTTGIARNGKLEPGKGAVGRSRLILDAGSIWPRRHGVRALGTDTRTTGQACSLLRVRPALRVVLSVLRFWDLRLVSVRRGS